MPGYSAPNGPGFEADELSFWTAGIEPHRLPDGIGIRIPAQSDVVLQVHYHPDGKPGTDLTRVGLYSRSTPVKQALHWNNAASYDFRIPPGKDNVEVKASWMIPVDVEALAVSPHMHLLGHDMHMSVRLPNGRVQNSDRDRPTGIPPGKALTTSRRRSLCLPGRSSTSSRTSTTRRIHETPTSPPRRSKSGPTSTTRCASATSPSLKKGRT